MVAVNWLLNQPACRSGTTLECMLSQRERTARTDTLGDTLERLWQGIESRRGADPASSYTAKLLSRGKAKIAQKFGEEAGEAGIQGGRGGRVGVGGGGGGGV